MIAAKEPYLYYFWGPKQPFTRLWVKVSNILTTCPYFNNLEFHIFDAGSPQCHFISCLLPLQFGFEGFQLGLPGHFKFFQGHFFQWDMVSGVKRSGDTRDDWMVVCPPINSSIEQWSGVWWSMSWIHAVCDVTILGHFDIWCWFGEVCWQSVHIILHAHSLLVTVAYNASLQYI